MQEGGKVGTGILDGCGLLDPKPVETRIADGDEHIEAGWRESGHGFRPGHHRSIPHAILGHEGIVDNEGGDFPAGITVEIVAGNFGVFTRAEYQKLAVARIHAGTLEYHVKQIVRTTSERRIGNPELCDGCDERRSRESFVAKLPSNKNL